MRFNHFLQRHIFDVSVFLSGFLILAFGAILGWQAWHGYAAADKMRTATSIADRILDATLAQARERGLVSATLNQRTDWDIPERLERAQDERSHLWDEIQTRITSAPYWKSGAVSETGSQLREALLQQREVYTRVRIAKENAPFEVTLDEWFEANSRVISTAADLRDELLLSVSAPTNVSRNILLNRAVWKTTEDLGQLRGLLVHFVERDEPVSDAVHEQLRRVAASAFASVQELLTWQEKPSVPQPVRTALRDFERHWLDGVDATTRAVLDAAATGDYPMTALEWFDAVSGLIASAETISATSFHLALARIDRIKAERFTLLGTYGGLSLIASAFAAVTLVRTRKQAARLFMQKELIETSLRSIADAVVAVDSDGRIRFVNPVAEDLIGQSSAELHGHHYSTVLPISNTINASHSDPIAPCLEDATLVGPVSGQSLRRIDGETVSVETWAAPMRNIEGEMAGAVLVISDTDNHQANGHLLSYQANRDALTDLPNRRQFLREIAHHLADEKGNAHPVVIGYLDLDQFKVVNDVSGHMAGDRMLQRIAFLLKSYIRDSDTLARLGGDEFGLLLRNCDISDARTVAEKLLQAVDEFRFANDGQTFRVGLSIGLAELNNKHINPEDVLRDVDMACHSAKEKGRHRVEIYREDDDAMSQAHGTMQWLPRINSALDRGSFVPYYQAIEPLKDGLPRRAEALVRLDDGGEDPIAPMAFIPAAERYGLMVEIDRQVFTRACRQLQQAGKDANGLILQLNVSGCSLSDAGLADFVRQTIHDHELNPSQFCFEITETTVISDLERALNFMETLKEIGVTFALDDFGTGVSSFGYLKTLPVDQIKIDGSFIRNIGTDPTNRAVVGAIVQIARTLSLKTVAEFAESEDVIEECRVLGLDYVQGFGVGRPGPLIP